MYDPTRAGFRRHGSGALTVMLNDLSVLVIDCQATGNHPRNGHLLEMGWLPMRASQPVENLAQAVRTCIVRLPDGHALPKVITRLTGIGPLEMEAAVSRDDVWPKMIADARTSLVQPPAAEGWPTVIHFARFETPYLEALYGQWADQQEFPLDIVCTHQMATRLLPGLPRKGLRAVAGYFGHSVPMARRCGHHLLATAVIWRHLVNVLQDEATITTWAQLKSWLSENPALRHADRRYPMAPEKLTGLPDEPGVYRFLRSNGDVLYIGKARSLRQRVRSYFHNSRRHSEKNLEMLSQAMELQWDLTRTGVEAALLESSQIKAHLPPYNRALVADQRSLVFISSDFRHQSTVPDARCPLGPLPHLDLFEGVHALGCWLQGGRSENGSDDLVERILGIPAASGPDEACFKEGLRSFSREYRTLFRRLGIWRGLMAIGRVSWLERLARADENSDAETPDTIDPQNGNDPLVEDKHPAWSPEDVLRVLEARLRHCGHLLRRARWQTLLLESSVAWQDSRISKPQYRALVLKHGQVVEQGHIEDLHCMPIPPEPVLSFAKRKACFDLDVYDRLRVLTTELRRLLAENRSPTVRLTTSGVMGPDQLGRLLKWI